MPTISMFYGIIIRMYFAPREHPPPHIHAYYGNESARIDLDLIEITDGSLTPKQAKLVLAWVAIHQDELLANWELVMNGELPFKIAPLQ
jgi:hypothetical protein